MGQQQTKKRARSMLRTILMHSKLSCMKFSTLSRRKRISQRELMYLKVEWEKWQAKVTPEELNSMSLKESMHKHRYLLLQPNR